jgi:pantoate--beta-alanine ligase
MRIVQSIAELRSALAQHDKINFVPTMGNLHDGHLSLVRHARERPGVVVASIFVNQLQFAPQEDFAAYPRTLEHDSELLARGGCDLVFAPSPQEMYPEEQGYKVHPPGLLGDILEGAVRPGFFTGVCTVVLKLFNIVRPSVAVFGKKDYQQLRVIQSMVQQLALPIEIIEGETLRGADGLALSSRNGYLKAADKVEAAQLHEVLHQVATAVRSGRNDWQQLERSAAESLSARGWQSDYVAIRNRADLGLPSVPTSLVVLGAARLGNTRLIDNEEV